MPLMAYLADAGEPAQLLPAREQMAFTLGFHIILVRFGVAFAFLMLVANYRGLRRHDDTAMPLAERWSRVAAVEYVGDDTDLIAVTIDMSQDHMAATGSSARSTPRSRPPGHLAFAGCTLR